MKRTTAIAAGLESPADARDISMRDREYLAAWDNLTATERGQMAKHGIFGPLRIDRGPVNYLSCGEGHDPFAGIAAATPDFDQMLDRPLDGSHPPVPPTDRALAAEAVTRVLYILTASRHPRLRVAADCLLAAALGRSDEKSQAEIGRKYGLTRAAISKRMRQMRSGDLLGGLEIYYFGGRKNIAYQARERAKRVHRERRILCNQLKTKPSPLRLAMQAQAA